MGLNPQMYVHVVVFLFFHYVFFSFEDRQTDKKISREQSAISSTVAQIVSCWWKPAVLLLLPPSLDMADSYEAKNWCAQEIRRDLYDAIFWLLFLNAIRRMRCCIPWHLKFRKKSNSHCGNSKLSASGSRSAILLCSALLFLYIRCSFFFCLNRHANNIFFTAQTWPSSLWWCRSRSASISRTLMSCSPCAACTLLAMSWF